MAKSKKVSSTTNAFLINVAASVVTSIITAIIVKKIVSNDSPTVCIPQTPSNG